MACRELYLRAAASPWLRIYFSKGGPAEWCPFISLGTGDCWGLVISYSLIAKRVPRGGWAGCATCAPGAGRLSVLGFLGPS